MPRNTDLTKYGEMRMVSEYIASAYPNSISWTRLRLGSLIPDGPRPSLTAQQRAMLGVFRRWADAAVVTDTELIIIEGSLRSDTGDPSKLVLYGRLVPHTPDLKPYLGRRLVLELVAVIEDPAVSKYARELGIRTKTFTPEWWPLYLAQLHRRERRPPQVRGLEVDTGAP